MAKIFPNQTPMINIPSYDPRKMPAAPMPKSFLPSRPDLGRIGFLTQEAAAPGVRKLRTGLQRLIQASGREENPNVRGLLNRQAMQGFGEGLSSVYGGARREGMGLYAPEYAATTEAEGMNWKQAREKELLDYESLMSRYNESKPLLQPPATPWDGQRRYTHGFSPADSDAWWSRQNARLKEFHSGRPASWDKPSPAPVSVTPAPVSVTTFWSTYKNPAPKLEPKPYNAPVPKPYNAPVPKPALSDYGFNYPKTKKPYLDVPEFTELNLYGY